MSLIKITDVNFKYATEDVVADLSWEISDCGIVTITGPSGCGKTTVLRLIAGLQKPDRGSIEIAGNSVTSPQPGLRFSFQDFDAFPWMTVANNLLVAGASRSGEKNGGFSLREMLDMIGLSSHARKYPAELSVGMRKRLALGRCLASGPKIILFDEAFTSLDLDTRYEMYGVVQRLWSEWKGLILNVTHDLNEAVYLSTQVVVSTPAPFRLKTSFEIPFAYPRNTSIEDTEQFLSLYRRLRSELFPE